MAEFKVKTRGNASAKGKPRVYFTCHPADFEKHFERICEDIFKSHDCAIYYTEDMTAVIEEQDKATDLGSHNLFIVPVTFRLLSQPNRAMDADIPYALQNHIPVLPFMMEPGIDVVYSRPDKFGELQYLKPYSTDLTEISYEGKLKKYLESVLISDELAQRVRKAFDAYIFLSYRKKDRRHANELMRLIHSHPELRDIAIWYDEFLTPGKSFRESIDKMLADSDLFALLVTPNLLEEPEGKPNFVMGEEYPAAKKSGIGILPTEMEDTDKIALGKKFDGIPDCIKPDDEGFKPRLMEALSKLATAANDDDPMHNYLIGLAYLEGIDVETDRARGLELITKAAEADLPEAMEKLCDMYREGTGVALSYREAAKWAERLYSYRCKKLGKMNTATLVALNSLAVAYRYLGDYKKALKLGKKAYALRCRILGKEHPDTLVSLNNLATTYGNLGDHQKALELKEKAYALFCRILGEEHPDTLTSLNNLAVTHIELGEYQKALELGGKAFAVRFRILGYEAPDTISSLRNLAEAYGKLGNLQEAVELYKKVYTLRCYVLGKDHPDTLTSLSDLAKLGRTLGDHKLALGWFEEVYSRCCCVLGEDHPDALRSLYNLALTYVCLRNYKKALELLEKVYTRCYHVLGLMHPDTGTVQHILLKIRSLWKKMNSLQNQEEELYALRCDAYGKDHPDTQEAWANLQQSYRTYGVCQHCGGAFDGQSEPKCIKCGKPKDY